eukprot:2376224-Rhodomonas_salina.3
MSADSRSTHHKDHSSPLHPLRLRSPELASVTRLHAAAAAGAHCTRARTAAAGGVTAQGHVLKVAGSRGAGHGHMPARRVRCRCPDPTPLRSFVLASACCGCPIRLRNEAESQYSWKHSRSTIGTCVLVLGMGPAGLLVRRVRY